MKHFSKGKRFVLFKREDILWWLGLIVFWFVARFVLALPNVVKNVAIPSFHDYRDYFIEGIIISSVLMITVGFLRNFNEKDKVTEKKVFGIKFVWHKKYVWWWIGMTVFWGVGHSLIELYRDIQPHVLRNFIKAGIFFAIAVLGAGFWEGNPGFFEGRPSYLDKYLPKSKKKK